MRAPDNKARPTTIREAAAAIAVLAGVPEAQRQRFCERILVALKSYWMKAESEQEKEQRRRAGLAFPRNGALAKAARTMRAASDAFDKLDPKERERVQLALEDLGKTTPVFIEDSDEVFLPAFAENIRACEWMAFEIANVLEWAIGIAPKDPFARRRRGPGRRRGRVYPYLHSLVITLMGTAELCRGRLTFDRHNESGTLLDALEIMRPVSPPGLMPKALSFASIERARTAHRRNMQQLAELLRERRRKQQEEIEF
jgi:hypothetical protein